MKQGKLAIEILALLILVVFTSATILVLITTGVISVNADSQQQSVLNADFIPSGRSGSLVIKEFNFCTFIDESYNCVGETNQFQLGQEVHFLFAVESSTFQGQIMIVENYRIKDPAGNVILDVNQKDNFNFDTSSKETKELITIKDFFTVNSGSDLGEYTLGLVLENPLLNKQTTLSQTFLITEEVSST